MKMKPFPVWIYIITLINYFLLFKTYTYLSDLKSCPCVDTDLSVRLKNNQVLLIILSLASSVFVFFKPFKTNMWLTLTYLGFMLAFYSYFIYYVYQFHFLLKTPCKCAMHWERYYLYYQAFMGTITTSLIVFTFLVIGVMMISMPQFRETFQKRFNQNY